MHDIAAMHNRNVVYLESLTFRNPVRDVSREGGNIAITFKEGLYSEAGFDGFENFAHLGTSGLLARDAIRPRDAC